MAESLSLREHAQGIWQTGVAAVDSGRLVRSAVTCDETRLMVCQRSFYLPDLQRLVVVGAGKAGAGMAGAIEELLPEKFLAERVSGFVNVPADCVRPLQAIHLHAARPAGVNEPTAAGVEGAESILRLVGGLSEHDLCLVLISGGGSALLPAPLPGISLADKQAVTRLLMHAGAPIQELNCVRKRLSAVKGGDLARAAAGAGALISLIISDVIGDPVEIIASGPTVSDPGTNADALEVLRKHVDRISDVPESVWRSLEASVDVIPVLPETVSNHVIGNNQVALEAAATEAATRGFHVHSLGSENAGEARQEGVALLEICRELKEGRGPVELPACVLSGGEPLVRVVATDQPRRGGRNQELVLAALAAAWDTGIDRLVLLAGGTDGEDGPTDAAGAMIDQDLWRTVRTRELHPEPFLAINDSYTYFDGVDGLLKTGPTHTNVMDLRVALVDR